jgi:hypothetical protein
MGLRVFIIADSNSPPILSAPHLRHVVVDTHMYLHLVWSCGLLPDCVLEPDDFSINISGVCFCACFVVRMFLCLCVWCADVDCVFVYLRVFIIADSNSPPFVSHHCVPRVSLCIVYTPLVYPLCICACLWRGITLRSLIVCWNQTTSQTTSQVCTLFCVWCCAVVLLNPHLRGVGRVIIANSNSSRSVSHHCVPCVSMYRAQPRYVYLCIYFGHTTIPDCVLEPDDFSNDISGVFLCQCVCVYLRVFLWV